MKNIYQVENKKKYYILILLHIIYSHILKNLLLIIIVLPNTIKLTSVITRFLLLPILFHVFLSFANVLKIYLII